MKKILFLILITAEIYSQQYDTISINNITMWVGNDGITAHNPISNGAGLFWPKDHSGTLVFKDGLIWGGKINEKVYVGGTTWRTGLKPNILGKDTAARIWKLKSDWEKTSSGDEFIKFVYNYNNWPGKYGAPFKDLNGDRKYTPGVDIPEVIGDEIIWYSANDFDTAATRWLYGSDPIGVELQSTTYAYNRTDDLADVVFREYKLINKSGKQITDMYLGLYSDADIGYPNDDYVGCDTVLNLGYVYNADDYDENYYGINPPSAGYMILQNPDLSMGFVKEDLNLSAFMIILNGIPPFYDPDLGTYQGSLQTYGILQGKLYDGKDMVDPITQQATKFAVPGDPVARTGWYEGEGWPNGPQANQCSFFMSSGPFNLTEADTQEIVIAFIAARGSDYINSVAELKRKARFVQEFYDQQIITGVTPKENIPIEYSLLQNYPNPFNPSTTIKYSVPEQMYVTLKVFDALGREVTKLVNEVKPAGNYQVSFNSHNLSSGVYYYQLKTDNYISTKKMMLIK